MIVALPPLLAHVCGALGTACIIIAYAYVTGRPRPDPYVQHGTNLAGAMLLTVSLLRYTNPASLVLEGFWAAIAIWGLWRARAQRRNEAGQ